MHGEDLHRRRAAQVQARGGQGRPSGGAACARAAGGRRRPIRSRARAVLHALGQQPPQARVLERCRDLRRDLLQAHHVGALAPHELDEPARRARLAGRGSRSARAAAARRRPRRRSGRRAPAARRRRRAPPSSSRSDQRGRAPPQQQRDHEHGDPARHRQRRVGEQRHHRVAPSSPNARSTNQPATGRTSSHAIRLRHGIGPGWQRAGLICTTRAAAERVRDLPG